MKFYDKLILIDEITSELGESEDREELITIINQTFHHHVLDIILTHLPHHHHEEFLHLYHQTPHDEALLDYINQRIDKDIKAEIQSLAQKLKSEILSDIRKSKPKK
ncbi:MAG: Uncharacterized protein G01um101416_345 [Microgenomates group bacterium Gr01-1014_16]|nr:MAG: Uncharacterized protein G01um101416_345 [Microgenomates group bacterium Gr01-1014_16]